LQDFLVGSLHLSDIARHLALTGSELFDGLPHLSDIARHLASTGRELFDGLPHLSEIPCYLLDLLQVRRRGGRGHRRSRGRSSLRNGRGSRRFRYPTELPDQTRDHLFSFRRPPKLRSPSPDYLLSRLSVRLPGQSGGDPNTDREQEASERSPGAF
jgi:hypothetical protein